MPYSTYNDYVENKRLCCNCRRKDDLGAKKAGNRIEEGAEETQDKVDQSAHACLYQYGY